MKKVIEFIKKYKTQILIIFLVLFFFRSCSNSTQVRRLEKSKSENQHSIDSLIGVINGQKDTINKISEVIRMEKIKLHSEYDNWISQKNRSPQLMELHFVVKNKLKELQKD
jgi:hypothetical protein